MAIDELATRLADEPKLAAAYAEAVERFTALGGEDLAARAKTAFAELGLSASLETPFDSLSGGEQARVTRGKRTTGFEPATLSSGRQSPGECKRRQSVTNPLNHAG